jgi:hypothetical protein
VGAENIRSQKIEESQSLPQINTDLSRIGDCRSAHLGQSVSSVVGLALSFSASPRLRGEILPHSFGSTMPVCFWYFPALSL